MFDFDERQLIQRIQSGDQQASFTPLVLKYQHKIYRHILGRIKNIETAEDLLQETWMKAYLSINTFRGDAAFYSWLYRIAENVCIDFFRKKRKEHAIEPLHVVDERRIRETHPCPSQGVERAELREQLQAALKTLTPIRKRVFYLYYKEELPIKAIAQQFGRSEGTIKSHLRNTRLQLRGCLASYLKTD